MILRIRSRDGLERITVTNPSAATVATVRSLIDTHLGVPAASQTLSLNPNLLLPHAASSAPTLHPSAPLSSLPLSHGSLLYLSYPPATRRCAPTPPPSPVFTPAARRMMTLDDLLARQVRVARQESPHCAAACFDRGAANSFQLYAANTLSFAVKRAGFLYGSVRQADRSVAVDFIYEPPQQGSEDAVALFRDPDEEALVEVIAAGLGMRRVGFVFTQAVGRRAGTAKHTMSGCEVLQAVELQAEGGVPEWVTAIVKLDAGEHGEADVHFEAFQMSDTCVRLFKEGWFVKEFGKDDEPGISRMKKDVVVGQKATREVDNDFFLVPVKISDHQGPLSSTFPVENRISAVTLKALKGHLDQTKHRPFVKRLSDFHLLLLLSRYLDANADVPALAECVRRQASIPEGYRLLIESLAAAA